MKILNKEEIKLKDDSTIKKEGITSFELVDRAALKLKESILKKYSDHLTNKIHILCGNGNNGADGILLALLLRKENKDVYIYIIDIVKNSSSDFLEALRCLSKVIMTI
jgi:ADP-dependent NAD(P)H-hydrate dehydratase / NAD(P)H-hydrate epimerase